MEENIFLTKTLLESIGGEEGREERRNGKETSNMEFQGFKDRQRSHKKEMRQGERRQVKDSGDESRIE